LRNTLLTTPHNEGPLENPSTNEIAFLENQDLSFAVI
jgi:hypothetical protein